MNLETNSIYILENTQWMETQGSGIPTKSGFSIPADEVSSLIPLLEDASDAVAQRYRWNTQLELELEQK